MTHMQFRAFAETNTDVIALLIMYIYVSMIGDDKSSIKRQL